MLAGVISGVARQAHNLKFLANQNSTTILTGLGVGGTAATAYLSGKASFKAARIIDREEAILNAGLSDSIREMHPVRPTKKEKVKLVWKCYIPATAVGATTITCIIMAQRINSGKIAALVIASGISERALQEYKDKVIEKLGDVKERNLRDELAQDRVTKNPVRPGEVIVPGIGDVLFYDQHGGRYFHSTMEKVRAAENKINFELLNQIGCSLSEFYDEVGSPPSNYSDSAGWNGGERIEVVFSTTLSSDDRPCIAIDFRPPPTTSYRHTYG